jgi:hypothetical protein
LIELIVITSVSILIPIPIPILILILIFTLKPKGVKISDIPEATKKVETKKTATSSPEIQKTAKVKC